MIMRSVSSLSSGGVSSFWNMNRREKERERNRRRGGLNLMADVESIKSLHQKVVSSASILCNPYVSVNHVLLTHPHGVCWLSCMIIMINSRNRLDTESWEKKEKEKMWNSKNDAGKIPQKPHDDDQQKRWSKHEMQSVPLISSDAISIFCCPQIYSDRFNQFNSSNLNWLFM